MHWYVPLVPSRSLSSLGGSLKRAQFFHSVVLGVVTVKFDDPLLGYAFFNILRNHHVICS
jgi:hypothetical protein